LRIEHGSGTDITSGSISVFKASIMRTAPGTVIVISSTGIRP